MNTYILGLGDSMKASERYYELTKRKHVYNIMPIKNIPSVLDNGIVCFNKMEQISHTSIALPNVQDRRSKVEIPNGRMLHEYANLYFSYKNPMLYKRRDQAEELCILAISSSVLDVDGCIVSDRNAAAALARFYPAIEGLEFLDFEKIHMKYWTSEDPYLQRELKAIKCSEVLVPNCVDPSFISSVCVLNEENHDIMLEYGFNGQIIIGASNFFR